MKIYKCAFSGDELLSDTYPMTVVDDIFYRVKGRFVTVPAGGDVDPSLLGSNPSAEEPEESSSEVEMVSGVNIAFAHRMNETGFNTKKEFFVCMKEFVKKLQSHVQEKQPDVDISSFKEKLQVGIKSVMDDFKQYTFYIGESNDVETGTLVLCKWEVPEGETDDIPFMYFFKDALIEEKV